MGARLVKRAFLVLACASSIGWAQSVDIALESTAVVATCSAITPQKVEAALALALEQSGRYRLVMRSQTSLHDSSRPAPVTSKLRARINCFQNLVRADIELQKSDTLQRGSGYGLVRHRWEQSDQPLADPALLHAIKRAFCVATGDSLLYMRGDSTSAVYPAALVAVTSLEIRDNPSLPRWELFDDNIATSYSGILAAITGGQRSSSYVVLDIDTRDSIYAHFRLYEPEPGMPPSQQEIAALAYFGVEAIVSGWLERTTTGARIVLRLLRAYPDGRTELLAQVERTLDDDSRVAYLLAIANAAEELLARPLASHR